MAFVRVLILQIFLGLILGGDGYQESASSNVSCLTEHDVNTIITNWATLFNRPRVFDYDQVIDRTVTNDVIAVDNSFNFLYGLPGEGPYASNKTAFAQIAGTINPAIGNETFKAVDIQYNCKSITLGWQASVEAVGPNEASPNNTAVPGSLFTFKGTDLLYISRNSNLVERVDSSGDFLQFLYYSGVPVAFQLNVPRATCLPINEPAIAA